MLLGTTDILTPTSSGWRSRLQTADTLATNDDATVETKHWIRDILASSWAASLHSFFHQGIVVLGKTDQLEDSRVAEADGTG